MSKKLLLFLSDVTTILNEPLRTVSMYMDVVSDWLENAAYERADDG